MELFSSAWFSALLAIVLIDLVLAGDNAIVIALAARQLPPKLQRRAIVWGTVGAIVVRSAMTLTVVWLLRIPGLMLLGGLGLVWIAYKLLLPQEGEGDHQPAATTFWGAMKTIVVADALMGIDNVLGVAGAAHGSFDLVVIGLLISVPIVVWGSTLVLKLVERFPVIIYLGAGVLAYTAAHMIVSEPLLDPVFDPHVAARIATYALLIAGVLIAGRWAARRAEARNPTSSAASPEEPTMTYTIAVFVNDADQAQAWLAPMLEQHRGARWVLVACAPRLTRRIGKFAAHANRQQWRREWCEKLFARLLPLFGTPPQTLAADAALQEVVQRLRRQHGDGLQLLDARRPRLGAEQEPLVPTLIPANRWAVPVAVSSGLSVMLALAD